MAKRIFITKTQGEWEAIVKILSDNNRKAGLPAYVRKESSRLIDDFEYCPNCITKAVGDKEKKSFYLSDSEYKSLEKIAETMKIPVSAVIDDLVISPLLLPK